MFTGQQYFMIPNQNLYHILHRNRKVLKFISKHKSPQIAEAFLSKKKRNVGNIRIPDLTLNYRTLIANPS
jgi:hypothetical protein